MAAATDLDNRQEPVRALLTDADLRRFEAMPPDKPRFAFLHWGQEFTATPGPMRYRPAGCPRCGRSAARA